ncbi:MAG: hypothetical protein LBS09_07600 [Bacteroidales bacterium]|nr:hypothetical protein [Bacteroidales bacterium]
MIFDGLRLKVARRILRRKSAKLKRQKMLFDFASAKYIGIICASSDETSVNILKSFLQFLSGNNIKYQVLGYFNGKKIPNNFLFRKEIDFITQNNLNAFCIPKGEVAEKFMTEPFDMLLNCSMNCYFPIEYMVQVSMAKCKVGISGDNFPDYDLMIDVGKKKDIGYFLDNLRLYLSNLRNSNLQS